MTKNEDWRKPYECLGNVLTALEPLSCSEQARVLLMAILRFAPNAFSDADLLQLVHIGKEPQP
jgi:hypothetical protein